MREILQLCIENNIAKNYGSSIFLFEKFKWSSFYKHKWFLVDDGIEGMISSLKKFLHSF
ncbi:Hypothetical protein Minf_2466 [Methylacidiphilum infernorum V4]|uniref:Uncharacterized protein n=1 Tax=Methylacidiphilum infernorum (isolate V4) TaxID=481448 RepID=B3E1E3_METI4|nr:Hypothetical protein Minf_2466 [Methylacidiphilum infernorum V4]